MAELIVHGTIIVSTELELREVKDTCVMTFSGRTVERMRNKETGEYESFPHFFTWEIWDTAARFLYENAKKGDRIVIHSATPRQQRWKSTVDGELTNHERIVFRINKFELCNLPVKPTPVVSNEPTND